MPFSPDPFSALDLKPLPYHQAIREYLKTEEADIWRWYASHQVREEHAETVRFDLLKSTYRVDRQTQPEIYAAAENVAGRLSLDVPITIYQAQNPLGLNASLAYVPREAHVVLHGPITSKLADEEVRALLAHELSHLKLWRQWGMTSIRRPGDTSSRTWVWMSQPARSMAGVMYFVQMSRSLRAFLLIAVMEAKCRSVFSGLRLQERTAFRSARRGCNSSTSTGFPVR